MTFRRIEDRFLRGRPRASRLVLLSLLAFLVTQHSSADVVGWPADAWPSASAASQHMEPGLVAEAVAYAEAYGGAGLIVRHGHVVASWGNTAQRYDLKSTTKSIGVTALGLAMADGLALPGDGALSHMPAFGLPPSSNAATGWLDEITLLQLATHTAGFAKPGGYGDLLHAPGSTWLYSDGSLNWLADVLTTLFKEDLNSLLFRRVFTPLGITPEDLVWRSHAYRETTLDGVMRREFGSGIKANVDAMARIGYLYLGGGLWNNERILPAEFVDLVRQPSGEVVGLPVAGANPPDTSSRYGVAWFTNSDGRLPEVPNDAYWAWGLLDSLIVVIPSLDIVAVRTGQGLGRTGWNADYDFIAPFITPIARSASVGVPVPDPPGAAAWLRFDGKDDVASVPSSETLKLSTSLTVEARIRPQTMATNKRQDRILRKGVDYELMLSTNPAGCASGTSGHLQLSATIGGTVRKLCGGSLSLDAWQHVAATYDGNELALYVDGSRVASMAASGAIRRSGSLVTIGNVKALSRAFHGDLTDVGLWSRALTAEEVLLRSYGAPSGSETGLAAFWPLREGSGQAIRDEASGGVHGRLGLTLAAEDSDPAWAQ